MPTLRYFAAAAEAAGTEREEISADSVSAALEAAIEAHGPKLAHVIAHSSLLLKGQYVWDRSMGLAADDVLDVLPPFAGG